MKVLKRNQLIILVISLMLVTAGYLNFTSTNEKMENKDVVAELGDATLVSNNNVVNENQGENKEEKKQNDNESEVINENETIGENEAVETNQEDTYFTTSKLERENIYSQMLESYQEIYNNVNSTVEQKNLAIEDISKINEKRNAIMIAENLVKAKGFEDIVIFSNSNSVSVIIKAEKLEPEQIAQIQNIVSRELEVGAEAISISTK
jgi:stage III sporulation protein AH